MQDTAETILDDERRELARHRLSVRDRQSASTVPKRFYYIRVDTADAAETPQPPTPQQNFYAEDNHNRSPDAAL